jgi:hypothetical protein
MKYNAIPTQCEALPYGEVEDYTVNITAGAGIPTICTINLIRFWNNYLQIYHGTLLRITWR